MSWHHHYVPPHWAAERKSVYKFRLSTSECSRQECPRTGSRGSRALERGSPTRRRAQAKDSSEEVEHAENSHAEGPWATDPDEAWEVVR